MKNKLFLASVLVFVAGAVFVSSVNYINAASPRCSPWPSCKKTSTPTPTPTPNLDNQRVVDVNSIRNAVEAYYLDYGYYPTEANSVTLGAYLSQVPVDPVTGISYPYAYNPVLFPSQYQVWAELANPNSSLLSDSDINSNVWMGGVRVNGANENCTAVSADCIYDLGRY